MFRLFSTVTGEEAAANVKDDASSYEVASQYQLMWWKFRKHRLAMIAAPVLLVMYLMVIFTEFIAPTDPIKRHQDFKDHPPAKLHFVDAEGNFSPIPFVYKTVVGRNPETFKREYTEDTTKKYHLSLFVKGEPYKLMGFIPMDIHMFGIRGNDDLKNFDLFLMGTDDLGRDMCSRIVAGARISLSFGFISIIFTFTIGLLLGGLSGYLGGIVDNLVQRVIELLLSIPTIPLWMTLAAALPKTWSALQVYLGMVLIMSLIGWTGLARVVRGKILSVREEDFVTAARLAGSSHLRIIVKHLIPSFMSYIIVNMTLSIPGSILGETSLSFLGLGLAPPVVSWGVLLKDAQNLQTIAQKPWLLWPAAFLIVAVLMFNFLGDGLRDAADPYK